MRYNTCYKTVKAFFNQEEFMNKKRQLLLNLALTIFFVLAVIVRGPNLNPLYSD